MTGFAFAHGTVYDMTSPTRMPVHLLALKKPAKPLSESDSALRAAVVNVANYYLRMAQTKSPAEMEAIIWGNDSIDGVDHGESCAAFASLTLALGAQATGQKSWVTGGTTYPWPLHQWADVRVDPNPASPGISSVLQDAQAHNRWHPLGDGYQPQPGDWVLFDGHVEVVTGYSAGVLYTIGGDSGPNLSVNAHTFPGPLAAQGVTGFVNNGELLGDVSPATSGTASSGGANSGAVPAGSIVGGAATAAETAGIQEQGQPAAVTASVGEAAVPGIQTAALTSGASQTASAGRTAGRGTATAPGPARGRGTAARKGTARMAGTAGGTGSAGMQSAVTMPGVMAGAGMAVAGNSSTASPGIASAAAGGVTSGAGQGIPAQAGSSVRASSVTRGSTAGRASNTGRPSTASRAGTRTRAGKGQRSGTAAIPGLQAAADGASLGASLGASPPATPSYTRNNPPAAAAHVPDTSSQQAFISQLAPGAIAAQSRYGIPAAVTIAQAIDESGWGQSALAVRDNNLFGIKGSGPAGSDVLPTQEFENGQWVTVSAAFRVYHNVAESIADHSELLATDPSYQQAMADRHLPDAFATDLTGVYATDPQYGSNLIAIMRLYNLYQYDTAAPPPAVQAGTANQAGTASQGLTASQGGVFSQGGMVGQGGAVGPDLVGSHGSATIPGVLDAYITGSGPAAASAHEPVQRAPKTARRPGPRVAPRRTQAGARRGRYVPQIPPVVTTAFITSAKAPLSRAEPLYDDVASRSGIRWELLAACDWMQCKAQPRYSPVHGEKLGTVNADRTVYRTKSEALAQCAGELIELAMAVYWIDITARRPLSVRDLAKVFAAFRWGGLLKLHGISAMEFPYSVEGLTSQHLKMRWPDIKEPNAPDKPATRFRMPFGAVPVVLSLGYPALA